MNCPYERHNGQCGCFGRDFGYYPDDAACMQKLPETNPEEFESIPTDEDEKN